MNVFIKCGFISLLLILSSCSGPGGPLLRDSLSDGEGELVQGCKNISSKSRTEKYITDFYMSTWGSAWVEGLRDDLKKSIGRISKALENEVGDKINIRGLTETFLESKAIAGLNQSDRLVPLLSTPSPYCQVFTEDAKTVSQIIEKILPYLGNDIIVSDIESGVFITNFSKYQHKMSLTKYTPRWLDRYEIKVMSEGEQRTVVVIFRDLYISRKPGIYNQAISVGHNEGWIFTKIVDSVQGGSLNSPSSTVSLNDTNKIYNQPHRAVTKGVGP